MLDQPLVIGLRGGLPELPGQPELPKVNSKLFVVYVRLLQKMLVFVIYSCYKINGPRGWRASFGPPATLLFLDSVPSPAYSTLCFLHRFTTSRLGAIFESLGRTP
jgi:hypothetical protein